MPKRGYLSEFFEAVVVKKLSLVETEPDRSNQHEFNGVNGLRKVFGDDDRKGMPALFIWLGDEQEGVTEEGFVSWYDARRAHPTRTEYRLYYPATGVSELMHEGDTMFLSLMRDGTALVIVTRAGSTSEGQLVWLFGVEQPSLDFQQKNLDEEDLQLDFASRYILDEIGIEPEEPETEIFDRLLKPYGAKFPTTKEFSELARKSLPKVDALDDPDAVLMAWLEREELLFRRLERISVGDRLRGGFLTAGQPDVEGFLWYSKVVQNRRKSRAGRSLEHHLEAIFSARGLRHARGAATENNNKPDFVFPGQGEYHDTAFAPERLTMLGAKSTCKDRWRQVLSEAERIPHKHLLTLEPGISENQTDEMKAKRLQLVLPRKLHETYRESQRGWLLDLASFIELVQARQEPGGTA